jgi:CDP-diglyceride synthetase
MVRVLSGVLLAAVFFAVIWFGSATVLLLVALGVCALAFQEYAELMRQIGADISRVPTLIATLAALYIVPFPYVSGEAVVGTGLMVIAVSEMVRMAGLKSRPPDPSGARDLQGGGRDFSPAKQAILNTAAGALSIIYLGLSLGALVGVHIFGGRGAVVLLIGTIAISDTAQYYSGRLLGRHPLAPRLSPKKTVEGAIGGFVVAPIALYLAGPYFVPVAIPGAIALLGVVLVAAGIAGDLFESMLKRAAEMKDSSALIPGHGGVLDRIDALLFAAPVFYLYLRWIYTR